MLKKSAILKRLIDIRTCTESNPSGIISKSKVHSKCKMLNGSEFSSLILLNKSLPIKILDKLLRCLQVLILRIFKNQVLNLINSSVPVFQKQIEKGDVCASFDTHRIIS